MFWYIYIYLSEFCSKDLQPGLYSFIRRENCFQSTLFFPLTEQPAKQQLVRFQKRIFNKYCLAFQSPVACENFLHYLSSFYLQHSKSPYPPVYDMSQWYIEKRRWPSTEPCGTPIDRWCRYHSPQRKKNTLQPELWKCWDVVFFCFLNKIQITWANILFTIEHREHNVFKLMFKLRNVTLLSTFTLCSCGSVVEHCVSSAKVVGSIPREHTYWQKHV